MTEGHKLVAPGTPDGEGELVSDRIFQLGWLSLIYRCANCRSIVEAITAVSAKNIQAGVWERYAREEVSVGWSDAQNLILICAAFRMLDLVCRFTLVLDAARANYSCIHSRTQPQNIIAKHIDEICPLALHWPADS